MARGSADTRDYNEPAVIELEPGHLLCLHRTTMGEGGAHTLFWQNESHDAGHTWSPPEVTTSAPAPARACSSCATAGCADLRPPPASVRDLRVDQRGRRPELGPDQLAGAQDAGGRPQRPRLHLVDPARRHAHPHRQLRPVAGITGITGTFWELP